MTLVQMKSSLAELKKMRDEKQSATQIHYKGGGDERIHKYILWATNASWSDICTRAIVRMEEDLVNAARDEIEFAEEIIKEYVG